MSIQASAFFSLINGMVNPKHGVRDLIQQIITQNHKLAHPETESEYFRWGLRNTTARFNDLCDEYEQMRTWYNTHTVDDMLEERAQRLQKARILVVGEMNMVRALAVNLSMARIARLDECIALKSLITELPTIQDLLADDQIPDIGDPKHALKPTP